MYTPTPSTRRPRPPSRTRQTQSQDRPLAVAASSSRRNAESETPLTAQVRRRQETSRSDLARISASPDIGDVSMGLDTRHTASSSSRRHIGLGMPSLALRRADSSMEEGHDVEPSPPPPYLQDLASSSPPAPTPLRQDSGNTSRQLSGQVSDDIGSDRTRREERMRARRASDAARALGLEVDWETSDSREWSMGSEEELSENTMRARLTEMRRQLRRRDNELLLAAEVANRALQTHEDLLAYLPPTVKARIPDLVHLFPPERPSQSSSHLHPGHHSSQGEYSADSDSHDDFATADDEPGSSQAFRTLRGHPAQSDRNLRAHRTLQSRSGQSPSQAQFEAIQQAESDERLIALEQALNDAKQSEDNQRKLAARLRKEVEKLHREFRRAEEGFEASQSSSRAFSVGTPGIRPMQPTQTQEVWRQREHAVDRGIRAAAQGTKKSPEQREAFGWGSTSFPQFPPGSAKPTRLRRRLADESIVEPELGEVTDRLRRVSVEEARTPGVSPVPSRTPSQIIITPAKHEKRSSSSSSAQTSALSAPKGSVRRSLDRLTLPHEQKRIRKRVSHSSFLSPGRGSIITPRKRPASPGASKPLVTVEAPDSSPNASSESKSGSKITRTSSVSSRTMRKSPWPSPHGSEISHHSAASNPRSHLTFQSSRSGSLSPAFASLSSRMATMRAFVASALESTPSRTEIGRTLGSELGSEYGDRHDSSLRVIEDALSLVAKYSPARTNISGIDDDRSIYSEGFSEPPAPLPATISAALSSLALALAPYASPLPTSRSQDSGNSVDSEGNNVFDDAFGMRKIRWADSTSSTDSADGGEPVQTQSVFLSQAPAPAGKARIEGLKFKSPLARPRTRPGYLRHSSDGSLALAHRRRSSQQIPLLIEALDIVKAPASKASIVEDDGVWEVISDEPTTIPGRLVHDILCLLAMLVDFIECVVVIVYRVLMDMKYNRRSLLGLSRRAKMKRYYI